jgi:hypothetical protein
LLPSAARVVKSSPILDRKINETGAGLPALYTRILRSISEANVSIIVEYIAAMKIGINLSDHYRKVLIEVLCRFSKYIDNKSFKDLLRSDTVRFLDSFRKTEALDPLLKWIGTYNNYRIHLLRLFQVALSP